MAYRAVSVFLILMAFFPLGTSGASAASDSTSVTDIHYWSYPEYTRVVITLSDKTDFRQKRLIDPDRLYFDIKNSVINDKLKAGLPIANGTPSPRSTATINPLPFNQAPSTPTTLAAFLPLMFWPGVSGKFMRYLPVTVFTVLILNFTRRMKNGSNTENPFISKAEMMQINFL